MTTYLQSVKSCRPRPAIGFVTDVSAQCLEASGPRLPVGSSARVWHAGAGGWKRVEVVRAKENRIVLMPLERIEGLGVGARVTADDLSNSVAVSDHLLGRVVDPFGNDFSGLRIGAGVQQPLHALPRNPMNRPLIDTRLVTGIRTIDTFLPIGRGQRVGIFAGSGVGKSTLLGMFARGVEADISVIALIGERGREVKEFVDHALGEEGLRRSVVVVATAEQPALLRVRAGLTATAIAEYFREQGKSVLLMVDSLTRVAMARREIGLIAGEPATSRGYTPSVFTELPQLCERCGTSDNGGAITAIYTVLVEGDDFNEPISDLARATLDGHIVLTRELAHEGHYPAIDVLQSVSRLASRLHGKHDAEDVKTVMECVSLYARNKAVIEMGVYKPGSQALLDRVIELQPQFKAFFQQFADQHVTFAESMASLHELAEAIRRTPARD